MLILLRMPLVLAFVHHDFHQYRFIEGLGVRVQYSCFVSRDGVAYRRISCASQPVSKHRYSAYWSRPLQSHGLGCSSSA